VRLPVTRRPSHRLDDRHRGGNGEIDVLNADGSGERKLTELKEAVGEARCARTLAAPRRRRGCSVIDEPGTCG
jgi:hypothetical protein